LQVGHKDGTVGQPLPGTAYRIIDPDTKKECALGEDGLILVAGPQVMKGFLKDPEKTETVILNASGIRWYMTGDKGHLDEDRYLSIVDRYSRFAKVGGEMVGLSAVENAIRTALNNPEIELMVTAIPDLKRGERLVLLHSNTIESSKLKEVVRSTALSNYMQPQDYLPLAELPKLGSGKADYGLGKKIAMAKSLP
jgi:acyl-[acyl-carrier-protein]-phospholipid O-acyltransferase/long-chain-fatty-acid--[acyl-carrier-protein] ligase